MHEVDRFHYLNRLQKGQTVYYVGFNNRYDQLFPDSDLKVWRAAVNIVHPFQSDAVQLIVTEDSNITLSVSKSPLKIFLPEELSDIIQSYNGNNVHKPSITNFLESPKQHRWLAWQLTFKTLQR